MGQLVHTVGQHGMTTGTHAGTTGTHGGTTGKEDLLIKTDYIIFGSMNQLVLPRCTWLSLGNDSHEYINGCLV